MRAYRVVAEDILSYMHGRGRLVRDELGWYRLNEASEEGCRPS
jgi:hypothetical protein